MGMIDGDDVAYTVAEVARRLSLSEVQVRREIKAGRLRCRRVGEKSFRILIPGWALREYLAPPVKGRKR